METAMRQSNDGIGHSQIGHKRHASRGFTLIEVMVVLALTLVMMAAFAQIFSMTGTIVAKQRGVGENDQSARILTTVLKNDLQNRTMRYVAPFHPNMPALPVETSRIGYFEYSENNPLDDTDDVLQFTIQVPFTNPITGLPNTPLYGTASFLPKQTWQGNTAYALGAYVLPPTSTGFIYCATVAGTSAGGPPAWPLVPLTTVVDNNVTWTCVDSTLQPDGDDGVVFPITLPGGPPTSYVNTAMLPQAIGGAVYPTFPTPYTTNNTGASEYAEVCYFLRHGNLYRRVLLIRQPYNQSASSVTQPGLSGQPLINGPYNGNFWTDFDYAARFDNASATPTLSPLFFGVADLGNLTLTQYPPGRPDCRFGHDQTSPLLTTLGTAGTWPTAAQTGNGAPREYDSAGVYLGRYTHEETSNTAFGFPGFIPAAGSPMAQATTANINTTTGGVTQYTGAPIGIRRGEDILLTNVLSFDVKIWDPHYSETTFDANRNGIIDTGPAFADIGHSAATGDFLQANNALPTYGPHASQAQNAGATANTFTVGNVTYYNNVFDTWCRSFNFDNIQRTYDTQAVDTNTLFAPAPYRPRIGVTWQSGVNYTVGTLVDPPAGAFPSSPNGYVYQCATAGTSGAASPFSQTDQTNPPTPVTDGTTGLTWTPLPPVAVQAIQIKVKYLDPTQNLLRQVTIVQALTP
jgi:prepilin-type N-terminal cleavage/methylation domain-containing protein